jgi:hypothetical protein
VTPEAHDSLSECGAQWNGAPLSNAGNLAQRHEATKNGGEG